MSKNCIKFIISFPIQCPPKADPPRAENNMTSKKPKVIVMSGYGLNCEEETKFAFEKAGGIADIVHLNDLIASPAMLKDYDILAFPGGFAYGDETGSGKAYANKFKNHLSKELEEFLARDTLVIGICNGFQIVTSLGIFPGALTFNSGGKYLDRDRKSTRLNSSHSSISYAVFFFK